MSEASHTTRGSVDSSHGSTFSDRIGSLGQSSSEHALYSETGPIADRSEHPFRASSMSHAADIQRGTYRWRQQVTAARVMGGRAMKRTHSVGVVIPHMGRTLCINVAQKSRTRASVA